jgi:hypothetical protein
MDAADAFWAASIVSRFTDTMIRGIVEEAHLTNPDAARYLADVIIKRRDKTVRWVSPLLQRNQREEDLDAERGHRQTAS